MYQKILNVALVASFAIVGAKADKVSVSNDQLGDFLIAPFYMAQGETCTKITVKNTNETNSILSKVAFREHKASNEFDLPIFLSPGDVWYGTVCEVNNEVHIRSCDDSNHPSVSGEMCTAPGKSITKHSVASGQTCSDFTTGYIEVYPIAQFDEKSSAKVDKDILVKRWDDLIRGKKPEKLVESGVDGYSLSANVEYMIKDENIGEIRGGSHVSEGYRTASTPLVAFKGTHDRQVTGSAIAYSNDTSPSLLLGQQKKIEILELLQHNKTSIDYDSFGRGQYIALTFPFTYRCDQPRTYQITVRDMSENKDVKEEVITIFSPTITQREEVLSLNEEVELISIDSIIQKTHNPELFEAGMIQIKDITNEGSFQLGSGKTSSFIASKLNFNTYTFKKGLVNVPSISFVRTLPAK